MAEISATASTLALGVPDGAAPLGGDGLLPSAFLPHPTGFLSEVGRWTRSTSNPILAPSAAWETTAVYEPTVIYDSGAFKMWYSGGWDSAATGYATSSDGVSWTKYAGNPVLGLGGSGFSAQAVRNTVLKVGATFYCYFADGTPNGNIRLATSHDGIAWTVQGIAVSAASGASWASGWANTGVFYDNATGIWHMLVEGYVGATIWAIGYTTSTDGLSFATVSSPLSALQVHTGGMYGGPWLAPFPKVNGVYQLWYHASNVASDLPTDLYRATSPDFTTWTQQSGPVLSHLGSGFEFDQVADPCVIEVNGTAYLYYDGDNNTTDTASIALATAGGPIADLVYGTTTQTEATSSTKTASYTLTPTDSVIYVNAASTTQTLPDATRCSGRIYTIKNDTSGATTTVATTAAQTIDGASTQSLSAAWNALTVQSTGAAWRILAKV